MIKILFTYILLFFTLNSTFADELNKEDFFETVIYKDNILKAFWYTEPVTRYYNWIKLDDNFVKMLVDENWKILHTVTTKILDNDSEEIKYYLDWKLVNIQYSDRILFLENWSVLIAEFNPVEWKNNFMSLDWKIIFEWNNDDYNTYSNNHVMKTIIEDSPMRNTYFKNTSWELIKILFPINWVATINKDKNYLVYDVVCKDNNIVFYYEWKELKDILNSKWYFPEERKGMPTYLNINWKSYWLTDNDVWSYENECIIAFNREKIKVENSSIIKIDNDNKKILWKEFMYDPRIRKIINTWWHEIYLDGNNAILWFNWIKYNISFGDKNKIETVISEEWNIIFVYKVNNNFIVNINWKEEYRWEKDFSHFIEEKDWKYIFKFNWKTVFIEELGRDNIENVTLKEYLELKNKNTDIKSENNIYSKLDVKLELLYDKISKKDLKTQLVIYKKFIDKFSELEKEYSTWVKREILDYISKQFTIKYKTILKEYILKFNKK